jgi:hypothetical protein
MALSSILLIITLSLWSLDILFSLGVNIKTIAVFALATAIVMVLEGLGFINVNIGRQR